MADALADAYRTLGLEPGAPWDDLRAAHRSLAKTLHPDRAGGDHRAMVSVNTAFAAIVAARPVDDLREPPLPPSPPSQPSQPSQPVVTGSGADDDPVTFSVNVLPVEAFEAVLIATSFLGDPWVIDEPYELSALLDPPIACRCHLSLVPEAGGTIVTVRVTGRGSQPHRPTADTVADAIIAELIALGA
jgi:hypothetical protein